MTESKNFSRFYVLTLCVEVLEIMITKTTELEAITLLKYDDLYS